MSFAYICMHKNGVYSYKEVIHAKKRIYLYTKKFLVIIIYKNSCN